ncbi:MAG: hypothetical protein AUH81_15730 [Candidatus Rokubacteria bacterium 13_1_40CM_4_69_5]|nr:MAG: hypothetical protein AUH81_15730 [Candidatus Rokubacteria bacterium 13_1_40CM_4_69_5]
MTWVPVAPSPERAAPGGAPGAGGEVAPRGWRLSASILALRSSTRVDSAVTVVASPSSRCLSPAACRSFSASRCRPSTWGASVSTWVLIWRTEF